MCSLSALGRKNSTISQVLIKCSSLCVFSQYLQHTYLLRVTNEETLTRWLLQVFSCKAQWWQRTLFTLASATVLIPLDIISFNPPNSPETSYSRVKGSGISWESPHGPLPSARSVDCAVCLTGVHLRFPFRLTAHTELGAVYVSPYSVLTRSVR